jgi:signal transduction histidine kinase
VSISIRCRDGWVDFNVEDDGEGFDTRETARRAASGKGVGLATMSERVTMMGGVFGLWSRKGEGTKINFSLPVENGGV